MNREVRIGAISARTAVALIALSSWPTQAGDWREERARQILHDHECEVGFLSQVVERFVEERRITMTKVHCQDKRSFDAVRNSEEVALQFKACEVPNAKTS